MSRKGDYGNFEDFPVNRSARSRKNFNADEDKKMKRHPPGLSGRQIGLFYRDQALKRREYQPKKPRAASAEEDFKYFSIDPKVESNIKALLADLKKDRAGETVKKQTGDDKYNHIEDSHFKRKFLDIISGSIQEKLTQAVQTPSKLIKNADLDERLLNEMEKKMNSDHYNRIIETRSKLPAFKMKNEVLDLINENQVVVISGETGCGKTTQVAQFILDQAIEMKKGSVTRVVCTQPRRISAISVAERVAYERGESLGSSVGYQIRLEKVLCRNYGSILFCTTGMLLQFLQGDPSLSSYSHIILDEIHERSTESDFIITLLKQIIPKRPDLKVVLMSATLNADTFSKYYDKCPIIHIPGFTHPIKLFYLEDVINLTGFRFSNQQKKQPYGRQYSKVSKEKKEEREEYEKFIAPALRQMELDRSYPQFVINELKNPESEALNLDLILELVDYISRTKPPGAILIFLPGIKDISNLNTSMLNCGRFPGHKFSIHPLHSKLPTAEQKLIFNVPKDNIRKIIIATVIAETSITIEDVVYVVDCGRTKLSRFDCMKNLETLEPEWIALANAKQRRGRAGRVQPGEAYHLFMKARERILCEYPTPEMLRTPLEQVILQAKILQLGKVEIFLNSVMDPPLEKAVDLSLNLLKSLNALDSNQNLTPLGYHLARLPLDPRTGKMIIWASMFSCISPIFSIAASLSFKNAFLCPLGKEDQANKAKLQLSMREFSDHIALAEALKTFEKHFANRNAGRFCSDYFLSFNTLKLLLEMKQQFAKHLCDMNFLDSDDSNSYAANKNSYNPAMIKAIVCAGLFPNIATVKNNGKFPLFRTAEDGSVKIHPSSVNSGEKNLPTPYITYFLKQKSTAIYLHDTTCVNDAAIIFAAPKSSIRQQGKRSRIVLTEDLSFVCQNSTAELIQELKEEMDKLLEYKITHPGSVQWESSGYEQKIFQAIADLISM